MSDDLTAYRYYREGRYIGILAYDEDASIYTTPTAADTGAILIRYAKKASTPTVETDSIDVDDRLARAIVCYVKKRLFEDVGNLQMANYWNKQFLANTYRSQNNKTGHSARISIPSGPGVLK